MEFSGAGKPPQKEMNSLIYSARSHFQSSLSSTYNKIFHCYLATFIVNFIDSLDSVQVINTRIKTNLVHDSDSSILGTRMNDMRCMFLQVIQHHLRLIIFHHGRGDVRSGDNILLVLAGSLDNLGVIDVRDQTNHDVY